LQAPVVFVNRNDAELQPPDGPLKSRLRHCSTTWPRGGPPRAPGSRWCSTRVWV